MDAKVNTFFISEKVAKIRWVPEQLRESERFLTGSWNMGYQNHVGIWRLHRNQYADDYNEYMPRCSDKVSFQGDVTGMEFVSNDVVATSCTDGRVTLLKIHRAVEEDTLTKAASSSVLHKFNADAKAAPCTALSIYGKEIATVGEDGHLNILDANTLHLRRNIEASSIALTAVAFVNIQEVLTANRMGVIRMHDVRIGADNVKSNASFMTSCEDEKSSNFVSCLTSHPTQTHIILAGSEEGSITVWDLRQPGFPASYLSAHKSTITEIGFHRSDPTKLFTAAEDGELWLWSQQPSMTVDNQPVAGDNANPWLNGERAKSRINVTSLISDLRKPINSFDAHGSNIICSSDSEAIYFIDNML